MSGVLSGVRVVELASWTYVPSAGAALADWGADVIKVEGVASGDPGRALVVGGFTREAARPDADFILELGNRGKRSIAIDIKSETGRDLFGRLLASADVLLTNWLPAALERARLTIEDIRASNPKIIIARGTGLGVRGPITSPTFVLARVHPSLVGGPALVHVDAYRLGSLAELDDLDLDASFDESVTVVEWGEGKAEVLAEGRSGHYLVRLDRSRADDVREILISRS